MKISKLTKLADLPLENEKVLKTLSKFGLHCVGCIAARFETIEEGAIAHGLDDKKIKELVKEINLSLGYDNNQSTSN